MFTRFEEPVKIDNELMSSVCSYMDDEIREALHSELCPCTNEEFLSEYLERDPDFAELLENELGLVEEKDLEKGSYEYNVRVLMADGHTRREAEKRLKPGTVASAIIYEADEFEKNFNSYMSDFGSDEDQIAAFKSMIEDGEPVIDWGVVEFGGDTYYIEYFN